MTKKLVSWDDATDSLPAVVQAGMDAITDAKILVEHDLERAHQNYTYAARSTERLFTGLRGTPVVSESMYADGGLSNGTVTNGNTRKRHYVYQDASNVRLGFCNIYLKDQAPTNPITVRASIEMPDGTTFHPAYFNGKRDVVIDPGGWAFSDPIPADLRAGTLIYSRNLIVVTAGQKWGMPSSPHGLTVAAWGEWCDAANGVTQPDLTLGGSATPNSASPYVPTVIVGVPTNKNVPVVGLTGDSILSGLGDSTAPPVAAGRGFLRRALNNQFHYVSIACSGDGLTDPRSLREPLLNGCTHIVCNYGVNDVIRGRSSAQIIADLQTFWDRLARRGLKVYQCTLTPLTTSTDAWATTGNQTPVSSTVRLAVNAFIRTVPAPLSGIFETADVVETARDSGIWKVGNVYTTDGQGVHPNPTGHAAIAAVINTGVFTV